MNNNESVLKFNRYSIILILLFAFLLIFSSYLYIGIALFAFVLLMCPVRIEIEIKRISLFLFAVTYILIYFNNYGFNTNVLLKCVLIFSFYIIGQRIVESGSSNLFSLIKLLFFAFFIHCTLVFFQGIVGSHLLVEGYRQYNDMFLGMELNATGLEAYYVPFVGMLYYSIKYKTVKPLYLYLYIVVTILASILMGTRGVIALLIVVIPVSILFDGFFIEKKAGRQIFKSMFFCLLAVGLLVLLYYADVFGIKAFVDSSELIRRFGYFNQTGSLFDSAERVSQNAVVLQNFDKIWISGKKVLGYDFVHNTWLSIINSVGIFPALFLIVFQIAAFKEAIVSCIRNRSKAGLLIMSIELSMLCFMYIEPTLESVPWLIMIYSFLAGTLHANERLPREYEWVNNA